MTRPRSLLGLDVLDGAKPYAALVIRLFLGVFLVYMSQDNVFSAARMVEFETFLAANGFPLPALAAPLSVYAQLSCGILFVLGFLTRWAALVVVVNFIVAIAFVHLGTPFRTFLEPCAMLAGALFLLLHGPGRPSIDA